MVASIQSRPYAVAAAKLWIANNRFASSLLCTYEVHDEDGIQGTIEIDCDYLERSTPDLCYMPTVSQIRTALGMTSPAYDSMTTEWWGNYLGTGKVAICCYVGDECEYCLIRQ